MEIEKHEIKASIPILTEQEIEDILHQRDNIVSEFTKQYIAAKEMRIAQLIMSDQQKEIIELRKENHNLKEQLENFIPRRRVRRVFKQLKKILEQDGITDDLED